MRTSCLILIAATVLLPGCVIPSHRTCNKHQTPGSVFRNTTVKRISGDIHPENANNEQSRLHENEVANNTIIPTLTILSGVDQIGAPDEFLSKPLVVSVIDPTGHPLYNTPITFVATKGGELQRTNLTAPHKTLIVYTDGDGRARVYFRLPEAHNFTSRVTANAGIGKHQSKATFIENSDEGNILYSNPFDATDVVAQMNLDGSVDVSWTNNTDPRDKEPINIRYKGPNGWLVAITVPAGTTSYHIPAKPIQH